MLEVLTKNSYMNFYYTSAIRRTSKVDMWFLISSDAFSFNPNSLQCKAAVQNRPALTTAMLGHKPKITQ